MTACNSMSTYASDAVCIMLCVFDYMQRVQVSLLRRIGDHCASISMPLSSGQ